MFLDIAKECTHALLSIANIQYWRESHKYFAPNSDELAMLHCWSVSLEEQFYLAWPLLIVWAQKIGRIREVLVIATFASFFGLGCRRQNRSVGGLLSDAVQDFRVWLWRDRAVSRGAAAEPPH
jgi:peptidoglycan/LPS O-acetylase OafA/YrhL